MNSSFRVSGTHCASCKLLIEDVAHEVPGVREAILDFASGFLAIGHDETFDPAALKIAIEELGAGYALSL